MIRSYTYQDAVQELLDYCGSTVSGESVSRDCKRSVVDALRELSSDHNWSIYYKQGRVNLNAPYASGGQQYLSSVYPTMSFDLTGGAYERVMTLDTPPVGSGFSQATWPTWAADAYVRVGSVIYRVSERKSSTQLTLDRNLCPVVDYPTGTTWTSFYQDTYLLPSDFLSTDQAEYENNFGGMCYVEPVTWLRLNRFNDYTGQPAQYTVTGDGRYPGRLVLRVMPYPVEARTIDFVYQRSPAALDVYLYQTGRASIVSGSTAVTGTGTAWTTNMEGSVIRFSPDGRIAPTGSEGTNPALFEATILVVTSATTLVVSEAPTDTVSSVLYAISSPIDVNVTSMLDAFKRGCERQMGIKRVFQDKPSAARLYETALNAAKAADNVSFARRTVGGGTGVGHVPFRNQPWNDTGGNCTFG